MDLTRPTTTSYVRPAVSPSRRSTTAQATTTTYISKMQNMKEKTCREAAVARRILYAAYRGPTTHAKVGLSRSLGATKAVFLKATHPKSSGKGPKLCQLNCFPC